MHSERKPTAPVSISVSPATLLPVRRGSDMLPAAMLPLKAAELSARKSASQWRATSTHLPLGNISKAGGVGGSFEGGGWEFDFDVAAVTDLALAPKDGS